MDGVRGSERLFDGSFDIYRRSVVDGRNAHFYDELTRFFVGIGILQILYDLYKLIVNAV